MGLESENITHQAVVVAKKAWNEHPMTQFEDTLMQAWSESEKQYRPSIGWQEEVGLYAQAEILLTQMINSDLPGVPAKDVLFSKQRYGSDQIGVFLGLSYEGIDKQLASRGIVHISYQNQPQLRSPQSGQIRWLNIDRNNTHGDPVSETYEFNGLSVTKSVTKFENGIPKIVVQPRKLNEEDLNLVTTILGNMSGIVEKLTVGH